jgi:hypothetical protein
MTLFVVQHFAISNLVHALLLYEVPLFEVMAQIIPKGIYFLLYAMQNDRSILILPLRNVSCILSIIMIKIWKNKTKIHSFQTDTKIVTNIGTFVVIIYLRNSYILPTM